MHNHPTNHSYFCVNRITSAVSSLLAALVAFSLSSPIVLAADNKPLNPEVIQHLNQDKFEKISSLKDFPAPVKAYYEKTSKVSLDKIFADPGHPFAAGCVRTPGSQPARGLFIGAKSDYLCIIYYQQGGIALVDAIDLFTLKNNEAERVWSSSMFKDHPSTVDKLVDTVKNRAK